MKIQSLSVVVPNRKCINHCASCPSRMHDDNYSFLMDPGYGEFDVYLEQYINRLEFARHNGCNTLMLTGTSEPQQNRVFLTIFGMMLKMMKDPFQWVEMQTTGVGIDRQYLRFLRNHVNLSVLALSVFSMDNQENASIINPPKNMEVCLEDFAADVKEYDLTLRLCLNLTKHFDQYAKDPGAFLADLKSTYGADQVTLRKLYESGRGVAEDIWVRENAASPRTIEAFTEYIKTSGKVLGVLPYGAVKYSVHGMSVVLDADSMGCEPQDTETYKYLILRPDCRLYSKWDDPASLIF